MRRTKSCRKMYKHIQWTKQKGFRPYDCQPCKNLHTAISVNKPKLSVTRHDQTLIWAHMYDTSRYTANTKMYSRILHTHTHTHTHRLGGGEEGIYYMQIWRDEFLRLVWTKMLMLSDEHHTVTSSTVSGPVKEKAHCPKVFVFVKAIWRVLVSEMERSCLDGW